MLQNLDVLIYRHGEQVMEYGFHDFHGEQVTESGWHDLQGE